jgi:hypothetical protein
VGAEADDDGLPVSLEGLPAAHLRVLLDGLPAFERYGLLLAGDMPSGLMRSCVARPRIWISPRGMTRRCRRSQDMSGMLSRLRDIKWNRSRRPAGMHA